MTPTEKNPNESEMTVFTREEDAHASQSTMSSMTAAPGPNSSNDLSEHNLEHTRTMEMTPGDRMDDVEKVPTMISIHDPRAFPDGGRDAWLCVVGGFCCLWCSFGWVNCIGIFQAYYESNDLKEYSPSKIAWISSLEVFCLMALGIPAGKLFDAYGPRYLLVAGTFMHIFGIMMISISSEYWHFILSQGLCSAIGTCLLFNAALGSVATWFHKKRAFVNGIIAAGSGLGGVIMPIMIQEITKKSGYPWAIRAVAFLQLGLALLANFTVKSRLPPKGAQKMSLSDFTKHFQDRTYVLIIFGAFFFFLGMFVPMNFLPTFAKHYGMSSSLAFYLVAIINSGSILGRLVPAYIADKVGRFNVILVVSWMSAVLVFCVWLPTRGNTAVIVFAVLYGFATGGFIGLAPALVAQISNIREIGIRNGMMFAVGSLGALAGNPIGGALISSAGGSFKACQAFSGACITVGAGLYTLARWNAAQGVLMAKV